MGVDERAGARVCSDVRAVEKRGIDTIITMCHAGCEAATEIGHTPTELRVHRSNIA
jgi:hypothetical protein